MLRISEALLTLAPLAAGILLWAVAVRRLPNRRGVGLILLGVAAFAALLVWQSRDNTLAPHRRYVPAQLQDGTVVEGHGG